MNPFKKLFGFGPGYNFPETHVPTVETVAMGALGQECCP